MKYLKMSLLLMCIGLVGCETLPDRDPEFAPVRPEALRPPMHNSGSIYQANYDMRLFEDQIARRVGDIITILFDERMQAKKAADINVNKDTDISVTVPKLYGMDPSVFMGGALDNQVTAKRNLLGNGQSNQSNSLTGSITVSVVDVLPNGNLKVRGEKRVSLNQGNEYIRVSGIIRSIDIDASNQIQSSQLADATIMYTGDGVIADASRPGWFSRTFMHWLFPF
ncbi:MAG: flagellar L-ring protein precursor FlgH [Methyloprofundus sp.]|nr:MAG: flagellar L-ring protein precursor FlgH [Methyloprofundus sp.]